MLAARSEIVKGVRQVGVRRLDFGLSHRLIHDIASMRGARLGDILAQLREYGFPSQCRIIRVARHARPAKRPRADMDDLVGFFSAKIANHGPDQRPAEAEKDGVAPDL